uniref:C-type lectin domain-containing protein n=1 Tax=Gadus morhua TaxID=8049 RepID=A0A8C5BWP8_GADMO
MDCRGLRLTETQAHPYPVFDNCNKRRSRLKPTVATCFPASRHILQAGYHGSDSVDSSAATLDTSGREGRSQRPDAVSPTKCQIWAVVVLLGLLSVVMLARLIGLAVQHKKTVSVDRIMEQLLQRLKDLTEQRDALRCKQECPDGWKKFGCKCYKTSDTYLSWNKSREFCVSRGADLVVVDSKEEMDFISTKATSYHDFWLGATDEAGEGMWRWVDGTVLSLDNPSWSRGGPVGGEDQNCLVRVSDPNQFKWADESCEEQNRGVCEQNRPVKGCGDGLMGPSCHWITPPGAVGDLMLVRIRNASK